MEIYGDLWRRVSFTGLCGLCCERETAETWTLQSPPWIFPWGAVPSQREDSSSKDLWRGVLFSGHCGLPCQGRPENSAPLMWIVPWEAGCPLPKQNSVGEGSFTGLVSFPLAGKAVKICKTAPPSMDLPFGSLPAQVGSILQWSMEGGLVHGYLWPSLPEENWRPENWRSSVSSSLLEPRVVRL